MACYHPLYAYGQLDISTGKYKMHIMQSVDHAAFDAFVDDEERGIKKFVLPCGQCIGCRLEYSRQWAVRCMLEMREYPPEHCWFVTLTYDDDHAAHLSRYVEQVDTDTGEYVEKYNLSLCKRDLQLFMKRLRIRMQREYGVEGVRFFACGEYGSKKGRPHFHVILFGCPLPDLVFECNNYRGDCYYSSAFLDDVWSNGFVCVGTVSFDSCAYVARYMLKKHKGKDSDYYEKENIEPEFSVMSRRPGIAAAYFEANRDRIYAFDQIVITGADGKAKRMKPPAFYDRLYDVFSPEDMARIREERKQFAQRASEKQLSRTSLDREAYLQVKENNKLLSLGALKRTLD